MNNNTTYFLFVALALLLGVLAYVLYTGPTEKPGSDALFPSMFVKGAEVKARDIAKVVIESKKPLTDELVFERVDDNTWKIISPRELQADSLRITGMIDSLISARKADQKAPSSLKSAGLEEPSRIITLSDKEGREWKLTIGEVTPGTERALAYVLTSDLNKSPLPVRKQAIESALENLNYFRSKELLGSDTATLQSIQITQGKKSVELRKQKDEWTLVQPPYGIVEIQDLLSKISSLTIDYRGEKDSDFVKDSVEQLHDYHLDASKDEVLLIRVTRGEGTSAKTTTTTIGIGKKIDNDRKYYATIGDGQKPDVVKISVESIKPFQELLDQPDKYRPKYLVQLDPRPEAIDITNSFGTFEFRRPDGATEWKLYRGETEREVDNEQVQQLLNELQKRDLVTSFEEAAKKKELGLEKPDVIVKVYGDVLDKPDPKKSGKPELKKDAKPMAELRFGIRDRGQVAVERIWSNDTAIVKVPQTVLDLVQRGPIAYLDRTIPPFNPGIADRDVTKIEITSKEGVFELERPTEKDPWTFTKPENLKGKKANSTAVTEMLSDLNQIRSEEIVTEKAEEKDLENLHLSKPPFRVVLTLTKDKKPETRTFSFGREVARGIHFKRDDREMVYLLNPSILNSFQRELRDTTIFDFDPEKVTTLTVKGWVPLLGAPYTLSLERKAGKWEVKSPAGYSLDPSKADSLVAELSRLKAEKFIPSSGKGLKLSEGALEIEVGLEDKKTYALTVGEFEGPGIVASSPQFKGETFIIPRASYEDMKKAPTFFRK